MVNEDRHRLHDVWHSMIYRCSNPLNKSYKHYGGRGITVCDEWQEFKAFYDWAIESGYKKGLSIDRINNDGNYEPSNCRWVTKDEQFLNRRNTIRIDYNGEKVPLKKLCDQNNMNYSCVYTRYCTFMKKTGKVSYDNLFVPYHNKIRKIGQYTKNGELVKIWLGVTEIIKAGAGNGNVTNCCRGKKESYRGFIWKYED